MVIILITYTPAFSSVSALMLTAPKRQTYDVSHAQTEHLAWAHSAFLMRSL